MIYFNTDLFLDSILLLLHDASAETKQTITQFLTVFEEDPNQQMSDERDLHMCFVGIMKELLLLPEQISPAEQSVVLLKFCTHPVLSRNALVTEALKQLFANVNVMDDTRIRQLRIKINNHISWHQMNTGAKQMFGKLAKCVSLNDPEMQKEMLDEVKGIASRITEINEFKAGAKRALEYIDLSDENSIRAALAFNKQRTHSMIMKTGLQGLNMSLGELGGFVPGEFIVFAALPHMYKSGMLCTLARDFATFNTPQLNDGLEPTILYISLENEAHRNMMWWYRTAYETTHMQSSAGLDDEVVISFLKEFYNRKGYKLICERHPSGEYGFEEYQETINYHIACGRRIVVAEIDYLELLRRTPRGSTTGKSSNARDDLNLQDMCNRFRDFGKTEGIIQIMPHALTREAAALCSGGRTNAVKLFGSNLMASGMGVERAVDVLIYMHLEINQYKQKYLTLQLRKHRGLEGDNTPETHKYCAYPFTQFGIIPDIGKKPGFTRDIYAEKEDDEGGPTTVSGSDMF